MTMGSHYSLDSHTQKLLMESSELMERWSRTECQSKLEGGMEEWSKTQDPVEANDTCDWYHGTWQYLRLLNMVAVPPWYSFYNEALSQVLRRKPQAQVLISAAADYGMLATLHQAIRNTNATPTIIIYDICPTPLKACQWYAERSGLAVKCVCDNLLTCEVENAPFDLIVTDEFLTVLKFEYKPLILKRWQELLKPGGVVVTTAMIGKPTTAELRQGYAARARRLLSSNGKNFPLHLDGHMDRLLARFDLFAAFHTRHMIVNEDEIRNLFSEFSDLAYVRTTTPGECVNPTDSFQITASL